MNELSGPKNLAVPREQEYQIIKRDLYKVLMLNAIYLAGLLVLYFTNKNTHYLEKWFSKILHF